MPIEKLDEESLQQLYIWIDDIPLSRPKRNIGRDFSDGVLIAEIIHYFIPKMVDLHNYSNANSSSQKMDNWVLLSRKCLSKLQYNIDEEHVNGVVTCKPGVIEVVLKDLRQHIEEYLARKKAAKMVEKNKEYNDLSGSDDGVASIENGQIGLGYDLQMNNYSYLPYPNQYVHQQQLPTEVNETKNQLCQYQNQPHVIQDIRVNTGVKTNGQVLSPKQESSKTRKSVAKDTAYKIKQQPLKNHTPNEATNLRLALEEKEQDLLTSYETIQILQAKVRRLEHLLHLKDLRLNELRGHASQLPIQQTGYPSNLPPQLPPNTNPAGGQLQQFPLPTSHAQMVMNTQHLMSNTPKFVLPTHIHAGFQQNPPLPQITKHQNDNENKPLK